MKSIPSFKYALLLILCLGAAAACRPAGTPPGPAAGVATAQTPLAAATTATRTPTPAPPTPVLPTATHTPTPTRTPTPAPPTATYTPTPSPTAVPPTPTYTPTPTPSTVRRYRMQYEIEHPTVLGQQTMVEKLWIPLPNTEGDGTRDLELLEVYPEGYEILDIGQANRAVYWDDVPTLCQQGDCRFGIRFEITLERPTYTIPWNAAVSYDVESDLFQTYTAPQRGIESDDPAVRELAEQIVGQETNVYKRVLLLQSWVQRNILYPDLSAHYPDDALLCIAQGLGDCAGQSKVFVALCQALGIPARTVSGLLPFQHGSGALDQFGPRAAWFDQNLSVHVWCEVYFPELGWVQCEPDDRPARAL
jgi:transglutaminase-like putative cysteine protease